MKLIASRRTEVFATLVVAALVGAGCVESETVGTGSGGSGGHGQVTGSGGTGGTSTGAGGTTTGSGGSGGVTGAGGSNGGSGGGGAAGGSGGAGGATGGSGGSSGGGAGGHGGAGGQGGAGGAGAATFQQVATLVGMSCGTGTCHNGTEHTDFRNTAGLRDRILGMPSGSNVMAACKTMALIVPNNTANSVISRAIKAQVTGCTNARMPDGCSTTSSNPRRCLTTAEIAVIDGWISAGAPM